MGVQLTKTTVKKMFTNVITSSALSTSLRIIGALLAMALLLWAIGCGYQAASESRRHPLIDQWISGIGALIMVFAFFLMFLGMPIILVLFLRWTGELIRLAEKQQSPKDTDIPQSINLKVDDSV